MTEHGFDVRWTPPGGPTRKIAFEPRSSGGYDRVEYEWSGCGWRQVGEEIVANVELKLPAGPISVADRIPKLAIELEVSERVRRRALEFAQAATDAGITVGRRPGGVAAACLSLAAERYGLCLSQREIATVAEVSPTTRRSRRDELLEMGV